MLRFIFDGTGEWTCDTERGTYRIQVCDDGSFDVSRSDSSLGIRNVLTFHSLREAKAFCCKIELVEIGV